MALDQSALTDLLDALRAGGDMDVFPRSDAARAASAHRLGGRAGDRRRPHERTETRINQRNGKRALLSTPAGDVELPIPKVRVGRSSRRCSSHVDGSIGRCGR